MRLRSGILIVTATFILLAALVGSVLLLTICACGPAGFKLVLKGAPVGSQVFVDEVQVGVTQEAQDFEISGLRPGQPRRVRVSHEGYEDYVAYVDGKEGEVREIVMSLRLAASR